MEKSYNFFVPAYVRWAMESPGNYVIFWTGFIAIFFLSLIIINFLDERKKKERRRK